MKRLLALLMLTATPASAFEPVGPYTLESGYAACKLLFAWEDLVKFAVSKDTVAFDKFYKDRHARGLCVGLPKGTVVFADNNIGDSDCLRVKARPKASRSRAPYLSAMYTAADASLNIDLLPSARGPISYLPLAHPRMRSFASMSAILSWAVS